MINQLKDDLSYGSRWLIPRLTVEKTQIIDRTLFQLYIPVENVSQIDIRIEGAKKNGTTT